MLMPQGQLFGPGPVPPEAYRWTPPEPPCLDGIKNVQVDLETTGLDWRHGDKPIGIAIRTPDGVCRYLPFGHISGNLDEAKVKEWARRELRNKHVTNINIKFDLHQFYVWGVDLEEQGCTVSDVGHYGALLDDHRRRFNLEDLSQEYLGEGKVQGPDVTRLREYPAGAVAPYAEQDVRLVGGLEQVMVPLLERQDLMRVKQLEDDVIYAVCEMERNAAPIDVELLDAWIIQSEQRYLRLLSEVYRETGLKVDPDRSADMIKLFAKLGLQSSKVTATLRASFDDEVLASIDHPVVKKVRYAKKLKSLRNKYLLKYRARIEGDGLLHYNLHQLRVDEGGTVTGRFSSSDVNIQQVSAVKKQRKAMGDDFILRRLFKAGSGMWLSADAMQIEYRFFAHYANAPHLIEAYEKDPLTDYHNIIMEMVRPFKPDIERDPTKIVNFCALYGGGIKKIATLLGTSLSQAERFMEAYHTAVPQVRKLLRDAATLASSRGYVHTIMGRRIRFPDKQFLHKALNGVVQGSATGDYMKIKAVELHRERKYTGMKMRMVVHDEVCGDVPDAESARRVSKVLDYQSLEELRVPILWDVHTGQTWADCK